MIRKESFFWIQVTLSKGPSPLFSFKVLEQFSNLNPTSGGRIPTGVGFKLENCSRALKENKSDGPFDKGTYPF